MATATKKTLIAKPVAVTIEGARIVKSKRGQQEHVLLVGETRTVCGIDTTTWTEMVEVDTDKTNCPVCIRELKAVASKT